eukprot:CAMPEP_0169466214 /NCGR_PEP_ID=MMETSP1042-20121227/21649_1 /TAXON_ID=464988 /ORGANISM="Hemiselmis andersenii, Strain CCMP1180" /LENGTH=154 /DNA_ID=CAMNT_0009579253 /DNA_START=104 /DNA_END=565 /DNA_ORIENTATION=+
MVDTSSGWKGSILEVSQEDDYGGANQTPASVRQRLANPRPPSNPAKGSDLFSKEGIESTQRGSQLRLLVHCEGCPPFLTVIAPDASVATLKEQVQAQHEELFRTGASTGDVPPVRIRWLEDSRRHALPLQSPVGALLSDREKVYAASRMSEHNR